MSIELQNIRKTFGGFTALDGVTLTVPDGELVALLGPSGSGKTTLLRIIAGLETPDEDGGRVLFGGKDVSRTEVRRRGVGFVFQHYALFKHLTVFENVAFGLRVKPRSLRPNEAVIGKKVRELLGLVQLEGLERRYPAQLSGGQRQRVALARALAVEPKVLLLDEPFGALDARVREELRRWLRRLHDEIHVTSVFVTHDQEEAMEVSDQVVVMHKGKVEQVGTPDEVFHQPANAVVMQFLGHVNLFHGRMEGDQAVFGGMRVAPRNFVNTVGVIRGEESGPEGAGLKGAAGVVKMMVRPHELELLREGTGQQGFAARVTRVHSAGALVKVEVEAEGGQVVQVEMTHERFQESPAAVGEVVFVSPRQARVFVQDFSI